MGVWGEGRRARCELNSSRPEHDPGRAVTLHYALFLCSGLEGRRYQC